MRIRITYLVLLITLTVTTWIALVGHSTIDRAGLLWFRDDSLALAGPEWLGVIVRDITALGSNWVLIYGTVVLTLVLVLRRRLWDAFEVVFMTLGGVLLSMGAKYIFGRPRPDLVPHLIEVYTPSFPSGHATMSMVCFFGGALVISRLWTPISARRALLVCALLSALLVGISRVMLGVHWPTDIIAGWLLGVLWVLWVHQFCTHRRSDVAA